MTDLKGCPFCNHQPVFRELVEGKVWSGHCGEQYRLSHDFTVMSWTSLEHCQKLWNTRYEDKK